MYEYDQLKLQLSKDENALKMTPFDFCVLLLTDINWSEYVEIRDLATMDKLMNLENVGKDADSTEALRSNFSSKNHVFLNFLLPGLRKKLRILILNFAKDVLLTRNLSGAKLLHCYFPKSR